MEAVHQPQSSIRHLHLVIPMKDLARAKSRLSEILPPDARRTLVLEMLRRVLATLLPGREHHGTVAPADIESVWIMSADPTILALTTELGARPLHDPTADLNAALEWARTVVTAAGADALLIIPADVPRITPADLAGLTASLQAGSALVIAPDRAGHGTNALGLRLPSPLPFQFGPDSFAQHLETARRLGLTAQIYASPTLALDVDTPEDFTQYRT
ncbi:MAG: 2-phospho-L-lactate guanylyltransferase [Chloroflexaceae bacterium]